MEIKTSVIDYIDQCFRTTIIGAIYEMEQKFKDHPEFQVVRKRILDKGNDQRRNAVKALNKVGIHEAQHTYDFEFVSGFEKHLARALDRRG